MSKCEFILHGRAVSSHPRRVALRPAQHREMECCSIKQQYQFGISSGIDPASKILKLIIRRTEVY